METTDFYAIAAGGIVVSLILVRVLSYLSHLTTAVSVFVSKHLTYPYLIRRHRLLGPWTHFDVLCHLVYVAANVFCLCYPNLLASDAGRRAGVLSLVNMIFLFAGVHLSFVADLLGISLQRYRGSHRAVGWMVAGLAAVHAVAAVNSAAFTLSDSRNLFAIIGIASLGVLSLLFLPCFRQFAYEIFLRAHQVAACLCVYAVWRHLPLGATSCRLYLYIGTGTFLLTCSMQVLTFIYRNSVFTRRGHPRALVTYVGADSNDKSGAKPIKVSVALSRPLRVHPGQYISLRMSAVGWWSWTQSHPFMVTSWSQGEQSTLELFVQPRRGLTADLLRHAHAGSGVSFSFPAFISGPHGVTAPVAQYETVVLMASGFGVAAVIPYLKQLIHGYNARSSRTRRVHLVWQLRTPDLAVAVQPWLNGLLKDDVLDNGYILAISIYLESGDMPTDRMPFGKHERAVICRGLADIPKIVQTEIDGGYIERLPDVQEERGEVLVMASLSNELRDRLRDTVRNHLRDRVRMTELEFQPGYNEN
ncbi:hypothetical protein AJ80_09306 [Polytolypa hystricis UAMH7299]|uniref:FAD-binding FR-type domain-containing protein n=1 Tax=Polytolypa hystricis (strain UAMH7299) TaxID=1447883 RepID=A0A2B7WSV8_POLH7|nr:hypothetical protein AJ80_09306 [Polytolypa hystricis UAMH7299]